MISPNASILTIGTEVTSGQIENRNSRWISDQLANISIVSSCHISVADIEGDILDALNFAAKKGSIIICTGGLGPTRDDITRDAIASWTEQPLQFSESHWKGLQEKLQTANVEVAVSNKRQCYFPRGAKVFLNHLGTADAFTLEHHGLTIIALPGPPKEISAIWPAIAEYLTERHKTQDPLILTRYQCLGLSESRLGEIVEEALTGSRQVTGYRPHVPYVEVKVWTPQSYLGQAKPYFEVLEQTISPWLTTRDDEDLASQILLLLHGHDEVQIVDALTQGQLAERLGKATLLGSKTHCDIITISRLTQHYGIDDWSAIPKELIPSETTLLAIYAGSDPNQWEVVYQYNGVTKSVSLKLPFRATPSRYLRAARFVTEMSLKVWRDWLAQSTSGHEQPQ